MHRKTFSDADKDFCHQGRSGDEQTKTQNIYHGDNETQVIGEDTEGG